LTASIRSPLRLLALGAALGVGADLLFYGRLLGVSAPIFALACVAVLLGVSRVEGLPAEGRNLWIGPLLLFFAAMVFVRASAFLTLLNVMACLALAATWVHFFARGGLSELDWFAYLPAVLAARALGGLRVGGKGRIWTLARGLLLALPVLCVFSALFSLADPVFAEYAMPWRWEIDLPSVIVQTLLIGSVALAGAGGLAHALSRRPDEHSGELESGWAQAVGSRLSLRLGFGEAAVILVLLDALFLAFVAFQAVYLFGGEANVSAQGYTYAEYARRGFFELIAVALLTLGVVLALDRLTLRPGRRERAAFLSLSLLMAGAVIAVLASAFVRLSLYEAAYGYTNLRLFSHVFIIWLAGIFVIFGITLWLGRPRRFVFAVFVGLLVYLGAMNLLNPDRLIAERNLKRYSQSGQLDGAYLARLSEDAVPLVLKVLDLDQEPEARDEVGRAFRERLQWLEAQAAHDGWPAFHLARRDALYALRARREALEAFPSPERGAEEPAPL
jgi:hypothetical protein